MNEKSNIADYAKAVEKNLKNIFSLQVLGIEMLQNLYLIGN